MKSAMTPSSRHIPESTPRKYTSITSIPFVIPKPNSTHIIVDRREADLISFLRKERKAAENALDRLAMPYYDAKREFESANQRSIKAYQKRRNREDIRANMDAYRAYYMEIFKKIRSRQPAQPMKSDYVYLDIVENCPSKPEFIPGYHDTVGCAADDCRILLDILSMNNIRWHLGGAYNELHMNT